MVLHFSRSSALNLLIAVALLLVLLPSAAPARAQAAPEIQYTVQTPPYHVETTPTGYHRLAIDGFSDGGQPGQPTLPYRIYNLALPPDADPASLQVELLGVETILLPGPYKLEAARAPRIKDQPLAPGAQIDPRAAQPAPSGADLLSPGQLRRWQFARVRFSPASYDPATGALTLITRATLRVTYAIRAVPFSTSLLSDAVMDDEAQSLLDNYDQALSWYATTGPVAPAAVADYVIVTTAAVQTGSPALADFVAFKQAQGFGVRVVTEADYEPLTAPAPNGRADKIRLWLQNNYVALGIRYVLLIGDPDPDDPFLADSVGDVPMKMCYPTASENAPTDAFYADLTGNWNADGDNRFCEYAGDLTPGGVDLAPEVYVGRIPVYNNNYAALDSILRKTIAYESDPNPAWRKSALLPMSFVDSITDDAHFAEQMKSDYLRGAGFSPWTLYQQGGACSGANSIFNSNEELRGGPRVLTRWMAADFGLVTWSGHGSNSLVAVGYETCWDGNFFSSASAASLDDAHPSIVYASACDNGTPEDPANLGYSLLQNGAVATVSASRVAWYLPQDYDFQSDPSVSGLGYEFNRRLAVNNDPAGKALFDAKNDTAVTDQAWLMNKLVMNLYGDPSAALLDAPPPANPVPVLEGVSPGQAFAGNVSFTLTLAGSNFVESSVVRWNGANLPTTFVSSTELTAQVDAARIAAPGNFAITVFNAQPGGGLSEPISFNVYSVGAVCVPATEIHADLPDTRRNDDPDLSTDQVNSYPVVDWDETGPEFAYTFNPAAAGHFVARLSNTTADLDVFVLDGAAGVCANSNVVAYGDNFAAFDAVPGHPLYILVDGYAGSAGQYTLTVSCPSCPSPAVLARLLPAAAVAGSPELTLTVTGTRFLPGAAVYLDGAALVTAYLNTTTLTAVLPAAALAAPGAPQVTVANPAQDLSNALAFQVAPDPAGTCSPALALTGPTRDTRRNDSAGSTRRLDAYGSSIWVETGPEFAYRYTPETDRAVSARLSGLSRDLDLIVIADDGAGNCLAANALQIVETEAKFDALAGQTYYFVVDGYKGAAGAYTLTVEDDLRLPAADAQLLNNRPVFNWEDEPGATGYYLQVSTVDTFRSLLWNLSLSRSVFFPSSNLPAGRTLYWRTIPRFGSRRGAPGPVRLLTTAAAPSAPSLRAPSSGALIADLTPRLDWSTSLLAPSDTFGRYQLQLARDATFLDPTGIDILDLAASEYTFPAPLPTNTRFYWRVRAYDAGGQYSNWSGVRSFRTALAAPLLSIPADDLIADSLRPRFEWAAPDPAASYTLQIATNVSFRSPVVNRAVKTNAYQPGALKSGRVYYWRVRAGGAYGPGLWSKTGWFYTP